MENKEKKQMLTTELTKEKSGGSAGMIQDMSINGIKLHLAQNGTGGPVKRYCGNICGSLYWNLYRNKISCSSHFRWKTGIGIFRLGKQRRYSERKASPDKV